MPFLYKLLPNPSGKDTLGELLIIKNNGTNKENISGWKVIDKSNKEFILPGNTFIGGGDEKIFFYSQTKIALNNNGDEIKLLDKEGNIIDTIIYNSVKEDEYIIHNSPFSDIYKLISNDKIDLKTSEVSKEFASMYAYSNKIFDEENKINDSGIVWTGIIFSIFAVFVFWYFFKKITNKN